MIVLGRAAEQQGQRRPRGHARFGRILRGAAAVVVAIAATLQVANMVFVVVENPDVSWAVPVSDLGRDVIGSRAARNGEIPFAPIGRLDPSVPAEARQWWIPHTPPAVAAAGVLDRGPFEPDRTARVMTIMALIGVSLAFAVVGGDSRTGLILGGASLASIAAWTDFMWVQLGTVTALALLATFHLEGRGRRRSAFFVLGVLIAWRPWLAPMAIALPDHRRPWRDLFWVALGGATAAGVALPFTGGFEGFVTWLTVATPANLAQYRQWIGNLSVTRWMPTAVAWFMFGVGFVTVLMSRRTMRRELRLVLAAVVIFTLSLLVWSHYWTVLVVALIPAMAVSRRWRTLVRVVVGVFAMAMLSVLTNQWSLASAGIWSGAIAVLILSGGLIWEIAITLKATDRRQVGGGAVEVQPTAAG